MQDPNADTEWNDVLRAKGILPPKEEKEITEDDLVAMVENTIENKSKGKDMADMGLDELDEMEDDIDEEDERMFEQYRRQRMAEMRETQQRSKFGEVREISKADWVTEVNKAGEGIWVIVHVFKDGIPLCKLMNQHLANLARKFPQTKFLRSVSSLCIPNYPDKNLPTVFVYLEGDMKKQFVGPLAFGGMNIKQDELEWMLSQTGAIATDLEEAPRPAVKDVMNIAIRESAINGDDSDDDY
ncbi:phosducin-like protein 3 [Mya arenaria]|uniref:phosducin-like protein 3 n=1 Tax=Mya arenaria TaxID=6604 RepID=UPI0022E2689D|nr:phosducin-like protein 3 [Mya arenaria]